MSCDSDLSLLKAIEAIGKAKSDAKSKGLVKGSGGRSDMPCPTECGGTLRYSVASINGHMHGACSTEGCVRLME